MSNAFDFHAEVHEEEKVSKHQAKLQTQATAKEGSILGASGAGHQGGSFMGSSVKHDEKAKQVAREQKQIDTEEKDCSQEEREKRMQERLKLSQMSKMERIMHKKEAAEQAERERQANDPVLRAKEIESLRQKRLNIAKKLRADRRETVLASLKLNGIDDGKGAQKLLTSYVDEVLGQVKPPTASKVPQNVTEKHSFKSASFFDKLHMHELRDVRV
jgi:hypothetical protein